MINIELSEKSCCFVNPCACFWFISYYNNKNNDVPAYHYVNQCIIKSKAHFWLTKAGKYPISTSWDVHPQKCLLRGEYSLYQHFLFSGTNQFIAGLDLGKIGLTRKRMLEFLLTIFCLAFCCYGNNPFLFLNHLIVPFPIKQIYISLAVSVMPCH